MSRADRVLAAYDGLLSAEALAAVGVTASDALAAASLVLLELELVRHVARTGDPDLARAYLAPGAP